MAPKRAAVADPPGRADGVRTHAVAHAELEDPGKSAAGRHADHEALQDAKPRTSLHHSRETDDRSAGHQAVRIERQYQVVILAPALAKVAQIAGLVADVGLPSAIDDALGILDRPAPSLDRGFLIGRDIGIGRVAQDEVAEGCAMTSLVDAPLHRLQPP